MKKIIDYITIDNPALYYTILYYTILADSLHLLYNGNIPYSIYLLFNGITIAYFLCLSIKAAKAIKLSTPLKILSLFVCIIIFIADVISISIYNVRFNADFATIFLQTNLKEATEFIETYLSMKHLFIIVCLISLPLLFKYLPQKIKSGKGILIAAAIGIFLTIHNPATFNDSFIGKIKTIISLPQNVIDLRDYLTHPQITQTKNIYPKNIIMLIGESFHKKHSSLYGYTKETNPLLLKHKQDSLLYIFQNVESPNIGTFNSFKSIMSTYKPEFLDSIEWYRCTTIPEIVNKLYKTIWVSNQSKIGVFDTAVGRYADLCDEQRFTGDKFAGMTHNKEYDESVIEILQTVKNDSAPHKFIFIQLMGSHYNFKHRYPQEFEKFKPQDYANHPEHQRENLAAYDNSILYNDSVVYEIINIFRDQETLLFYFSDHALDIYESSNDYIGHAKAQNSISLKAGKQIPFMIYTSSLYQKRFPQETSSIKKAINKPFRTDDMIYTIMDIIGVEINSEKSKQRSLLNSH